jgi:hypothetical protein
MNRILLLSLLLNSFVTPLMCGERPLQQPLIFINANYAEPRISRNDNPIIQALNSHMQFANVCHIINFIRERSNLDRENRNVERERRNLEQEEDLNEEREELNIARINRNKERNKRNIEVMKRNIERQNRNTERILKRSDKRRQQNMKDKQTSAHWETISQILNIAVPVVCVFIGLECYIKIQKKLTHVQGQLQAVLHTNSRMKN